MGTMVRFVMRINSIREKFSVILFTLMLTFKDLNSELVIAVQYFSFDILINCAMLFSTSVAEAFCLIIFLFSMYFT